MTNTRKTAAEMAGTAKAKAEAVKDVAAAKADEAMNVAAAKTGEAMNVAVAKADEVIGVAADKAGEAMHAAAGKAAEVSVQAQKAAQDTIDKMPEPVAQFVQRVMAAARERPVPFAIGTFVALMLLRRLLFGRRS